MIGEGAVALAAIGLTGTILAAVVTPLFKLLNANTAALNNIAETNKELVKETRKGNREAALRNGHLGEQNIQITELISEHNKEVLALSDRIMKKLDTQSIGTLNVAHSNVEEETVHSQKIERKVQ